jgi:hypothetical protein
MLLNRNFLVLGFGLTVCATAIFYYFSGVSNEGISKPSAELKLSRKIISEMAPTKTPTVTDYKMQQIINSGQLSSPPGDTERTRSINWPFSAIQRTAEPVVSAEGQSHVNIAQAALRIDSPKSSSQGIVTQSISTMQLPRAPSNSKPVPTQSQPIEFETPPGVGSPRGSSQ